MHILEQIAFILMQILKKFVSEGPVDIGSGNGLVLKRQQAITWTNVDRVHDDVWHHQASMS